MYVIFKFNGVILKFASRYVEGESSGSTGLLEWMDMNMCNVESLLKVWVKMFCNLFLVDILYINGW